jgi:hypothetical protein
MAAPTQRKHDTAIFVARQCQKNCFAEFVSMMPNTAV